MEVVTGATSSVLSRLGTLLQEEYYLQKGVKKEVESLQNELIFMRAALRKVADVQPEKLDPQVKAWAGNIKELSYDMKDAVDTYEVRVACHGIDGEQYCGSWVIKMIDAATKVKARHLLAGVIEEMKGLTMQVAELRDRYKLDNVADTTSVNTSAGAPQEVKVSINYQLLPWWRPRDAVVISSPMMGLVEACPEEGEDDMIPALLGMKDPVGVGEDMKKLGKWMTSSSEDVEQVRCILGVGGVGKTTVATALYRKYGGRFDHRAMVTVSRSGGAAVVSSIHEQVMPRREGGNGAEIGRSKKTRGFSTAAVGRKLSSSAADWLSRKGSRSQAGSGSGSSEEKDSFTNVVNELLENKSCLLLIDDVRSEKSWREISDRLPLHQLCRRSRIIVTARTPAVAKACRATHTMAETLNKESSKEVFMEALSESRNGRKEMCTPPPARLWEMCVNHPVALTAMAGHVACNPHKSAEEWRQVCSSLLPDSMEAINWDGVRRVLRHCYHDMPAEIKTCFLYLSMYAKGRKISRKHLTRRWMAEGFVGQEPGQSVEQVADSYFNQLIKRKMVQAMEQSSNGKVKSCKVYGAVHDFIVDMASEENLVTVFNGDSYQLPPSGGKVRRLSLSLPVASSAPAQSLNKSHVRSLAVLEGLNGGEDNTTSSPKPLFSAADSPILQVLDLQGWKQQLDMSVICQMLLLKYLSLRGTDTEKLPREIGKLSRLETLDVRETRVTKLPNTVWHLECLLCILGGDKTTRKALKIPGNSTTSTKKKAMMRSLQVLSGIEITDKSMEHLKDLTKLTKLAIYKLSMENIVPLETWIAHLGNNYLHTLLISLSPHTQSIAIENTSFKQLTALDVSHGSLIAVLPEWINQLRSLTKLTLPITLLRSDTLNNLSPMSSLFFLAFSHTAHDNIPVTERDQLVVTLESNTAQSDGEIIVPAGGFKRLRILRFSAPSMPPLSFLDKAMPNLERLELRSGIMEGLFGLDNLKNLKEVHLSVHVGADQFTKSLVENIAAAASKHYKGTRIIRDEYQINTDHITR